MADEKGLKPGESKASQAPDTSRRRFMKNSGMIVGGVAGGSLLGGLLTNQFKSENSTPVKEEKKTAEPTQARMFFERYEDFVVLEQATERILPEGASGPGAIELGVPYFIDKQMAGIWGINGTDYRQGPFTVVDPPVDQSSLNRGQIMVTGLRKMNDESKKRFDVTFDKAEEDQQIEIMQDFESSKVKLRGVSSAGFFGLLRELTMEGAYSDPLYGGNRNMAGWKMQEFPGAVPSYADIIEKDEFVQRDPMSLTSYQQKS
ncbi:MULTISPECIES: gluconate 2-dehydrogenase subunit 3 family protein [unclassified Sporosarcina]|uniref:gluconate 2-dehydrogenase subunit 3 family protein n=1 Tax=unclassified Sporosarcina TaxID=2647733 RepID=UPI000C164507|nr:MULTISPECIES: gluconate 2-dehydrogenase subunit 3 family protein [unclassified Sporosarcina]PIC85390.1 dehydrogenase [Sporosarcina sp. P20a]PIC98561.1 dehydrogenase [Sporosarcina sp. P29]PID05988.1 dehydrogenase [Sporosarcina sp. P30]PID09182.1 dehydrogenase [Sporosarcina sp. P31]PID12480.1 dehydrogenase [Sporosarcina sp. P32b]